MKSLTNKRKWQIGAASLIALSALGLNKCAAGSQSTTQEAQALIGQLDMVLEAAHQYAIDNGESLPITSYTNPAYGYLDIDRLIKNPGLDTWQGPYLSYSDTWIGGEQYIGHPDYLATQLLAKEEGSEWVRGSTPEGCSSTSQACSIAACIWIVPLAVAQEINTMIDGVNSQQSSDATGAIRYDKALYGGIVCKVGGEYPTARHTNGS